MESQTLKNIQHNITTSPVRPIYADDIVVAHTIKMGKDPKGKTIKEAHLQLFFMDMTTQKPIEKIIISPITAIGLEKALAESNTRLAEELKKKKIEKPTKVEIDYIR